MDWYWFATRPPHDSIHLVEPPSVRPTCLASHPSATSRPSAARAAPRDTRAHSAHALHDSP